MLRRLHSVRPGDRAALLELSDERDRWQVRLLQAWREGFIFGAKSRSDDYERGFHDGVMASKRTQQAVIEDVRVQLARWGGLRKDFGKPRPGDYPGGDVEWEPVFEVDKT